MFDYSNVFIECEPNTIFIIELLYVVKGHQDLESEKKRGDR